MPTTILIVDDAVTFRRLLVMALQSLGFHDTIEAGSAAEARDILQGPATINLVISDWHMPSETGLDFLRWVRAQPKFQALPFLMLTTEQERSHVLEAARVGIQGYIFKPVQKATLFQKLNELGFVSAPSVTEAKPITETTPP